MTNWRFVGMTAIVWLVVWIGMNIMEQMWATIALFHSTICICLFMNRKRISLRVLGRGWRTGWAVVNIGACVAAGAVIYFAWAPFGINGEQLKTLGFLSNKWLLLAYFSTINPVLEELFWRALPPTIGTQGSALKTKQPFQWISFVDVAFSGYHVIVVSAFANIFFCVVTFVCLYAVSIVWRYLYSTLKGLAVPVVAHAVIDFILIFLSIQNL